MKAKDNAEPVRVEKAFPAIVTKAQFSRVNKLMHSRAPKQSHPRTISAYAKDMRDFLNESELTERRAFIESFVKEIVVMPGDALMRYTIPISQSTQKTELFFGGRFGHNQVSSGGSAGGRATSTLIAGSLPHRWALLDG